MTITKQIERLENERQELLADMRGINPKLSSYKERQSKKDVLERKMAELRDERAALWRRDESKSNEPTRVSARRQAGAHSRAT